MKEPIYKCDIGQKDNDNHIMLLSTYKYNIKNYI